MSNRVLFGTLQGSIVFGYMASKANTWPQWLPIGAIVVTCAVPTAVCLLSFAKSFRRFSRWTVGASFLAVAFVVGLPGAVLHDRGAVITGFSCGIVGAYIMATGGRYRDWWGVPSANFLFALLAVSIAVFAATLPWSHTAVYLACVVIPIPFVIGCLLNHRWTTYYAIIAFSLGAITAGFESVDERAWLPVCIFLGVIAVACPFVFRGTNSFR